MKRINENKCRNKIYYKIVEELNGEKKKNFNGALRLKLLEYIWCSVLENRVRERRRRERPEIRISSNKFSGNRSKK